MERGLFICTIGSRLTPRSLSGCNVWLNGKRLENNDAISSYYQILLLLFQWSIRSKNRQMLRWDRIERRLADSTASRADSDYNGVSDEQDGDVEDEGDSSEGGNVNHEEITTRETADQSKQ